MVTIYILKLSDGTYYTGMTNNIGRRMTQHDSGYSRSTKRKLPAKLVYATKRSNYKEARLIEKYIKKRGARQFMLLMLYNPIIEGKFY